MRTSALGILIILLTFGVPNSYQVYRAAVYEHAPRQNLTDNIADFVRAIHEASSNKVDIIVFPEYGLLASLTKTRPFLKSIAFAWQQAIVGTNLCDFDTFDSVLSLKSVNVVRYVSCLAKLSKIFVALNFCSYERCEKNCRDDGIYLYNTNFVFDKDGILVAIYRKFHLIEEPFFDRPKTQDVAVFTTPFGKFGTFTCFDITFKNATELVRKYDVNNVIYPTLWTDSYPLYVSVDVQNSWASALNVNFLVANIHSPKIGAIGSGIYSGVNGALIYNYDIGEKKSRLLIADVDSQSRQIMDNAISVSKDHFMFRTKLKNMNKTKLAAPTGSILRSHRGLQCRLEYEFLTRNISEMYFFGALNGSISSDNEKHSWSVELCILFMCLDESCSEQPLTAGSSFSYVGIDSQFSTMNVFPGILISGFRLPHMNDWKISKEKIETIRRNYTYRPLYTALYGRNFALDKP